MGDPSNTFGESVRVEAFRGQETIQLGHFTRQGRFERHLDCLPVDGVAVVVSEDIEHGVTLTNILVIPC